MSERQMRLLIVICPLITLLLSGTIVGFQMHRRAVFRAELRRLNAEYRTLAARYKEQAAQVKAIHHDHDHDDHGG